VPRVGAGAGDCALPQHQPQPQPQPQFLLKNKLLKDKLLINIKIFQSLIELFIKKRIKLVILSLFS